MSGKYNNLIFVDVEADGPCPIAGRLREIGAVHYTTRETFYADVIRHGTVETFYRFDEWIRRVVPKGRRTFVSDNPAFDWQWIAYGFAMHYPEPIENPFGWSARRIGDFYAGLVGDFSAASDWKALRITPHDHSPVHDALGNVEAFERMLNGERA